MLPAFTYAQSSAIRGFLTKEIPRQQKLEQQARTIPEPARLRKYMDFISSAPHNAGSPRSKAIAEYILGTFKEWGLDAHIEEFEALMPYPTVREVEVLALETIRREIEGAPHRAGSEQRRCTSNSYL